MYGLFRRFASLMVSAKLAESRTNELKHFFSLDRISRFLLGAVSAMKRIQYYEAEAKVWDDFLLPYAQRAYRAERKISAIESRIESLVRSRRANPLQLAGLRAELARARGHHDAYRTAERRAEVRRDWYRDAARTCESAAVFHY